MYILVIIVVVITLFILTSLQTVQQGTVVVIPVFGKYKRIMQPGLNIKIPIIEQVYKRISIQNRSVALEFQAVTIDQANVNFKSMLLFSVMD